MASPGASIHNTHENTPVAGNQNSRAQDQQPANSGQNNAVPAVPPRPIATMVENRYTSAIILAVNSQIRDEDRLAPDGLNFASWIDFLEERLRDAIDNPNYLNTVSTNAEHERIARSILLASVDRTFRRNLARFTAARDMLNDLTVCFNSISRAAQLAAFRRLLSFNIADHPTTATVATAIMDPLGISLTRDEIAGLVLQNGLGSDPELMHEVYRRIKQAVQSSRFNRVPVFDVILRTIDIVRRNAIHRNESQPSSNPIPLAMQTQAPAAVPPQGSNHGNINPDMNEFMAAQAGLCWQCRSPDHLQKSCPLQQRFNSARPTNRPITGGRGYNNYAPDPPYGFQPFYPIIAPAGYTGLNIVFNVSINNGLVKISSQHPLLVWPTLNRIKINPLQELSKWEIWKRTWPT
ncbi:uncharacterized protein PGTG_21361 [Puccinia graminis f. sp. tritici CRL 75-36-700-3]|uniref:CCHC-type domain-containing protein n=1 Tax=Puccinia graminis f. sp. tritici (strain CRL 75-36-700-3 / race SCCL) TaxID=418459 RepID=H6QRE4_PUCGT|nr:uncharacterized protein PGTG_21361 [Puccinia graminis f. sp. tritici CRL 75-36-700-3]EHS63210.1 hypothetical protein PGTG_21361 [Puccinia graminis f. sp. tritici CRL 75-36-700-3]